MIYWIAILAATQVMTILAILAMRAHMARTENGFIKLLESINSTMEIHHDITKMQGQAIMELMK